MLYYSPMEDFIWSDSYDGYNRRLYKKSCLACQSEFYAPKHAKVYCSIACKARSRMTSIEVDCDFCHTLHRRKPSDLYPGKTGLRFCSRECKESSQRIEGDFNKVLLPHSKGGSSNQGYRAHALRTYGSKCMQCGYSETKKMLDVDHIDSNRKNNTIGNLQVLCVWCHALKTRKVQPHERFRSMGVYQA